MRFDAYLITTTIGSRTRRFVWHGERATPLDHPARWVIDRSPTGVWVRDASTLEAPPTRGPLQFPLPPDLPAHGVELALASHQGLDQSDPAQRLKVNIQRLPPLVAPYATAANADPRRSAIGGQSELFVYSGIRYYLLSSNAPGRSFSARIGDRPMFRMVRGAQGTQIVAETEHLRIKRPGEKRRLLQPGLTETLSDTQLMQTTIMLGKHWWRFGRVATAIPLPEREEASAQERAELRSLRSISFAVGMAFVALLVLAKTEMQVMRTHVTARLKPVVAINLKAPKLIPPIHKPEPVAQETPKPGTVTPPPPPPKPVAVAQPPPPPKPPQPPKKRARKIVEKKAIPHRNEPPIRLVKRGLPPRKIVIPQPPAPKPAAPDPAVLKARAEAQAKAEAKAQLTKSLGFLSPSANKPSIKLPTDAPSDAKYSASDATGTAAARRSKNSVLGKMAAERDNDGPIDTRSSRSIASTVGKLGRERNKGLNDVQGKVSLAALYDPNAAGDLEGAMSAKSFSVQGPGKIDQGAVERALQKHLAKFQYCYEKSLLSDPTLAGTVMMQWTIQSGGGADSIKVVRSQMNNAALNGCISRELANVRFPSPTGGPVIIKYPFAFSASSM